MLVVPDGFCTRDQNSSRNFPAAVVSVKAPNTLRTLLLGGIEPLTMVGLASFSAVPLPKESSVDPAGLSAFASTPDRRSLPVPFASQSIHGSGPSTFRFPFTSISKLLPDSTFAVAQEGSAAAGACSIAFAGTTNSATSSGSATNTATLTAPLLLVLPFGVALWCCPRSSANPPTRWRASPPTSTKPRRRDPPFATCGHQRLLDQAVAMAASSSPHGTPPPTVLPRDRSRRVPPFRVRRSTYYADNAKLAY